MMCSAQRIGGSAGNNKNDSELHKTDWAEKARHWAIVKLRIPRFRLACLTKDAMRTQSVTGAW